MTNEIKQKAAHIKHLITKAKEAGIEVIVKCPARLN